MALPWIRRLPWILPRLILSRPWLWLVLSLSSAVPRAAIMCLRRPGRVRSLRTAPDTDISAVNVARNPAAKCPCLLVVLVGVVVRPGPWGATPPTPKPPARLGIAPACAYRDPFVFSLAAFRPFAHEGAVVAEQDSSTFDAPAAALPAHWTPGARDTYQNVLDQRADLAGAEYAALEQAVELIASADALETAVREHGTMVKGSTGQLVVNPAAVEARLARTAAAQILARLVPAGAGARTNSQRGRDAARARWSNNA